MRPHRKLLAVAAGLALLTAACGSDSSDSADTTEAPAETAAPETTEAATTEAPTTEAPAATDPPATDAPTTTEYVAPARGDADLVIWADATKAPAIRPLADAFAADEGVVVSVLEVPDGNIRDQLAKAGPAGEGPDIIVGAHDWLGELVANGLVIPVELGDAAAGFNPVAIQGFSYEGKTFGLPYAVENVALLRNTELVPEAPATFEELAEVALQLVADGTAEIPLALQQNGNGDPYHNYPIFTGYGGYVFGQNADGSYNPDDVGIDSEGGLAAAQAFAGYAESGLINKDITFDIMKEAFASGKAPFAITGPWSTNDFVDAGVPFVVEPVPSVAGNAPAVFVGVQGFMISSFSEVQDLAKTFLLDYMATDELQLAMYDAGKRAPALTSAFEQISDDPIVTGFGNAATLGKPMPAIPEMGSVWESWTNAYQLVFTGTDPVVAFTDAATAIREKIAAG